MASQSKIVAELIGTSGQIAADKLAPGAGGTNWTGNVVTASTLNAEINTGYYLNTTSNTIIVNLPSSPSVGNVVSLVDVAATADSNRITIRAASGDKINGEIYDMDIDVERGGAQLTYSGSTYGWVATEAVNGLEGTSRSGKILVESHPIVTTVVNTTDSLAYFQADGDEVLLTGRNIKPNSVVSFVKASGGAPITYTIQAGDLNDLATQVTFNLPSGLDDDAANDPFDVYVTLPTSLDNPSTPLASSTAENVIEWLPSPTFTNASGSLGFIYSDDVDLSSLTFTSVAATSLDPDDTITYSDDGNLPAGLSVNTTTGTVEGTLSETFGNSGSTIYTFVVTATSTGETSGATKTATRTYSIELRGTKVTDAWIGSDGTTDYDGSADTTVQVVGYGFNGTDTVASVNFITGGNSYTGTSLTVIDDNNLTINTPQAFTTSQSNLDVEVVLTSGYTYKLSQSPNTTLLTTGSDPVAGTPYTLTNILAARGSYSDTLPTPTDADGNTSFTFTLGTVTQTVSGVTTNLSANANAFSFTLNSTTGALSATVPTNYETSGGTITLPVTIEDNAGNTVTQNYTITVDVAGVYTTEITNSLMFDGSSYLSKDFSVSNQKTWTWSGWVKRGNPATTNALFSAYVDANNFFTIRLREEGDNGRLEILNYSSGYNMRIETTQVFRDASAWYHLVVAIDTTQATIANRVKLYLNGSQITALSTITYPDQNFDTDVNNTNTHYIGSISTSAYHDGYMADIYFIDGQALSPTAFGEYATIGTDTYWIPKTYGTLPNSSYQNANAASEYGNNGFHLTFNSSATDDYPVGIVGSTVKDMSGNGNDWTANGF